VEELVLGGVHADGSAGGSTRMAAAAGEEALSSATKQKVAATKKYIEKHYKSQMKSLQERKERSV
jgi:serine/threonine kinase 38